MTGSSSERVGFMDEMRGLLILLMVVYHAVFDLVDMFGMDFPFFFSPTMQILQSIAAALFVLISGISCRYSHSNFRRGFIALFIAYIMTSITALFMPQYVIWFGILHLLGCSILLFAALQPFLDHLPPIWGITFSAAAFFISWSLPDGFIGWGDFSIALPARFYQSAWLYPLGFPTPSFFSADYFPLVPWFFIFLTGCYLGSFLYRGRAPRWIYQQHSRFLAVIGRKTLLIYLLHQPVLYGIFQLVV